MNKENTLEYTIPAGEFARICGTTRDTLRYYQKHKVLVPWQNPENGYHYYSYAQIGSFYFISTMRSAGFSIHEIRDSLSIENTNYFSYFSGQIDALKRQRLELDRKIRQLSVVQSLHALIQRSGYASPVIHIFPADIRMYTAPVSSGHAYSLADIALDIQDHVHLFPDMAGSFPAGTAMDTAAFLNGDYRYTRVVSLYHSENAQPRPSREDAAPGSIEAWESVSDYILPTRRLAAIVCRDRDGAITEMYRRLADFIRKNDLTTLSDVFSISIVNMMAPDQKRRYLKYIFVCIK